MPAKIESLQRRDLEVVYGQVDQLSPLIRRVVANNPGPFTFRGTGTYLIGRGDIAVVDPGPRDPKHLEALMAAIGGERVTHILITHTHGDHSPGARELKSLTGAEVYGFGPHPFDDEPPSPIAEPTEPTPNSEAPGATASETETDPVQPKNTEEGYDKDFYPDVLAPDGTKIDGAGWTIECVHTPGHIANHVCFALREEKVLFSGDHVMGWSTSVISPPGGDMAAYLRSLDKLLPRDDATYWPTHGPAIVDPKPYVEALIAHRRAREHAIVECLRNGFTLIPDVVTALYVGLDEKLVKAAGRSVLAHLRQLVDEGIVSWTTAPDTAPPTRPDGTAFDRPMADSVFSLE